MNQKAILVKNGSEVTQKCVYGGDTSDETMALRVAEWQAKYPSATVTLYQSDTDPAFVAAGS